MSAVAGRGALWVARSPRTRKPTHTRSSRRVSGSQVCSGRGGGVPCQSNARSTASRIWLNHHAACCSRRCRRTARLRRVPSAKPSSICPFVIIHLSLFCASVTKGVGQMWGQGEISPDGYATAKQRHRERQLAVVLEADRCLVKGQPLSGAPFVSAHVHFVQGVRNQTCGPNCGPELLAVFQRFTVLSRWIVVY